jgi:hypothetical protein
MGIGHGKALISWGLQLGTPTYPPLWPYLDHRSSNVLGGDVKIDVGINNLCRKRYL